MARTYVLRLNSTQTAAAAGVAEIIVPNNAVIVQAVITFCGTGGAGGGLYSAELALNNNVSTYAASNNPPREITLCSMKFATPTTTPASQSSGAIPMNVPVRAGERLSINQTLSGTAAGTLILAIDVFVVEQGR